MTADATKTAPKESFGYYMGPLNVEPLDHYGGPWDTEIDRQTYDQFPPSVVWLQGEAAVKPIVVNNRKYVALSASRSRPVPLGAFISGLQVVSGASASLLSGARLIAIAAGQIDANMVTVIAIRADDAPIAERMREITGARALVESRLDALSELPAGWLDGEGVTPTPAARATARDVIRVLLNLDIPHPRVAPTPEGGVEAEWSLGDREVSVTFEPDGSLYGNSVDVTTGKLSEPELSKEYPRAVAAFVLGRSE